MLLPVSWTVERAKRQRELAKEGKGNGGSFLTLITS